jgi:membrane-associated phospholipid phosphatase
VIALSTVFIKQHRALDVVGGVVWAAVAIILAGYFVG